MEKIGIVDFQKRNFKEFYLALYIVTKEIKIRTDTCITNKNLYVIWGLDVLGNKQILEICFERENDNRFWLEKFEDIKARNNKDIIFLITPKNKNIERCIKILYNDVKIIYSPDEITTSITKFLADRPSRKIQSGFKKLFFLEDNGQFENEFEIFKETYIENRILMLTLDKNKKLIQNLYEYNENLRKLFYPYSIFYKMKKQLNKLKTKEPLCTNINEVIEYCLPLIMSFEQGRTYSKLEWLEIIDGIYDEYKEKLEVYLNG